MVKAFINALKRFAQALGEFQTSLILGIFYYFLVTPFGLLFQLATSLGKLFSKKPASYWVKRDYAQDLKDAWHQF